MAPPHYESIVGVGSGIGKYFTHLSYDEGMSVLAVIEMTAVTYTDSVSCGGNRMAWACCIPKPRALTMSAFSRNDTDW